MADAVIEAGEKAIKWTSLAAYPAHYAAPLARRDSWLQRIEVYDDYAESPYERVAALLRQMGLHADTIGMEKTYVSAARWEEMQRLVPGARLVDCTALMAQVRWVKTPGEIQVLKAAADLLDDAYLEVFRLSGNLRYPLVY